MSHDESYRAQRFVRFGTCRSILMAIAALAVSACGGGGETEATDTNLANGM